MNNKVSKDRIWNSDLKDLNTRRRRRNDKGIIAIALILAAIYAAGYADTVVKLGAL